MIKTLTDIKKEANIVFKKIDNGIYEIIKDRKEEYSGRVYVGESEVIATLNNDIKVVILDIDQLGMERILHKTF